MQWFVSSSGLRCQIKSVVNPPSTTMRNGGRLAVCLFAVSAAVDTAQAGSPLLNSSYVAVQFGQAQEAIDSHSKGTFSWIAAQDYLPAGYLKSAFFAMAQWDATHKTKSFQQAVQAGNAFYAENPGNCGSYWNIDFVNSYNDFPSWCALAALEQDAAYGGTHGLEQAKHVFQVGRPDRPLTRSVAWLNRRRRSSSLTMASSSKATLMLGTWSLLSYQTTRYLPAAVGRACSMASVSLAESPCYGS